MAVPAPDIRICFLGDSFVNGTGDDTALGWVGRVCADARAGGADLTCYNLGIRRQTSSDVLARWRAECAPRLPAACDRRLVISFGVNDTTWENGAPRVAPAQACANLRHLLVETAALPRVMVGPPPIDDDGQNVRIAALATEFARICADGGVPWVDLFAPLVADPEYRAEVAGNDGAHPRGHGYARMAALVLASPSWWFHRAESGQGG